MDEKTLTFTLTQFEGPLPFLIQLVRKYEIDISGISLIGIVEQFQLMEAPFDTASHFIRCAAELVFLKSSRLLPAGVCEVDEEISIEDPFDGTVPKIIDYCRFKELAKELILKEQETEGRFLRGFIQTPESPQTLGIEHISLEELSLLFDKILSKAKAENRTIKEESWKVSDKIREFQFLFQSHTSLPFLTLFNIEKSKEELIVFFLAMLELIKRQFLRVIKNENGSIMIEKKEEPHES